MTLYNAINNNHHRFIFLKWMTLACANAGVACECGGVFMCAMCGACMFLAHCTSST